MRAKFVKAELLYSSAQPQIPDPTANIPAQMQGQIPTQPPAPVPNQAPPQAPVPVGAFGAVDYSAFSHPHPPPAPISAPPMGVRVEAPIQAPIQAPSQAPVQVPVQPQALPKKQDSGDYGSDFQIPSFESNPFQDGPEGDSFLQTFEYKSNGTAEDATNGILTSATANGNFQQPGSIGGMSKFGFGYDALSENLDELELATNSQELVEKFSQAKYQVEMGNTEKGNEILNEMMASKEIRYKEFSDHFDQHILNTFAPITE
mmetsp:Transcript_2693/g.3152  ORF Transcript_2693/g.3152 Transcript_2693/m.3152 type:complete len:260 (+) Transcript_2693:337-1116(+)|eukprot:CAMPEP_0205809800 /NCGR_PEP_ID=MMETSP0205-20121125/14036_1 /ASSEMBLY_ACC=CAM_ASM_000278 /TAXON_ID=36767 /ORGANISM="Euplotes focardii, Strain TN1" /LENGTH=259 /DNA_ID=CAMNT_0053087405 /DNA_START=299 /DNA_END=1078 /DNA_ORIENTATION=-